MTPTVDVYSISYQQAQQLSQMESIASFKNTTAIQNFLGAVAAADQAAAHSGMVPVYPSAPMLVKVVATSDAMNPYQLADDKAYVLVQPPPSSPVTRSPVGDLNPMNTVYNANFPESNSFLNGQQYNGDPRGVFIITVIATPFGKQAWWSKVA